MNREEEFEKFLGINTRKEDASDNKWEEGGYAVYDTSEYEGLIRIFDKVPLKPTDTLVDFGCGMGRVLFYCNHRFMCGVTGVEYNHALYKRLLDNAEDYHARFQGQRRKFSLLYMKAEEYVVEPEDNFFYFFNPFSSDVLHTVLDHIFASVEKNPRHITIIMYYCTYDMMRTVREYPLVPKEIMKLSSYAEDPDEKVYIYHNV